MLRCDSKKGLDLEIQGSGETLIKELMMLIAVVEANMREMVDVRRIINNPKGIEASRRDAQKFMFGDKKEEA